MNMEAFVSFFNSMGPVVIDRFGQENRCSISITRPDAFLLKQQARDGNGTLIGSGAYQIDIPNIESVAYTVLSFHEFSTGGPTQYFVNIILKHSITDIDGGKCRAIGIFAASDEYGKRIKLSLEEMAGLSPH